MDTLSDIIKLKKKLFPTGRAFRMQQDGFLYGLMRALGTSEAKAYEDSIAILNSLLPDNDEFSPDDATDWERRLGLITNLSTSLPDRKAAILRKMQAPGSQPAKGSASYIEAQLQLAGFNVFVYENIKQLYPTGNTTYNPAVLNPAILTEVQQGDHEQGEVEQGYYINSIVANSIYNSVDIGFDPGPNLRATFFIGGNPLGSYATVPAAREIEFRQLILKLKQVQNIAFLFITYI